MKTFNRIIASALALSMAVACYDDGTDFIDNATRITLTPGVERFNADGTLESGNESFVAAVVINEGNAMSDMTWEASVVGNPAWVKVQNTTVTTEFKESVSGNVHMITAPGVEVLVQPNPDWRRYFTLHIKTADNTEAAYRFEQLGSKPDALAESETKDILFMAMATKGSVEETVTYTSNMDNVYRYEVEYEGESKGWITITDNGAGSVTLKAADWSDPEKSRTAVLKIIVGTPETSEYTLKIPVTQNANYDFFYMYGASADGRAASEAIELVRTAVGIYETSAYFIASADNEIRFNLNGRTVSYPQIALAADGTIKEIASESVALPAGPEIDVDGMRKLLLNTDAMTWSWERISTPNAMPDSEVTKYPTKEYVTRAGGTKTWMTVGLHWNGGAQIGRYKLGSGLVSLHQPGGYGNEAPYPARNPEYDTVENGGKIETVKDASGVELGDLYGRLYSFSEALTGDANGCLNDCTNGSSVYIDYPLGAPGTKYLDAVGREITIDVVAADALAGFAASAAGDAQAEERFPELVTQIQGICPYGWHIANHQDWRDLIYAASQAGGDKPVDQKLAYYNTFGNGYIANFGALLFSADWDKYNPENKCAANRSSAADDFGFNMFSQGWRLYKTGYDYGPGDNDPRMYAFIPVIGTYTAGSACKAWRMWNQSRESQMRTNGGFDMGNGCGGAVRCVKNYK